MVRADPRHGRLPSPDPRTIAMSSLLNRVLAALPDALTACTFFAAWIAPAALGSSSVDDLVLAMLLQALVIFTGLVFMILIAGGGHESRLWRLGALTVMGAASVFIVANVLQGLDADHSTPTRIGFNIDHPEPLYIFGWLYASNFMHLLTHAMGNADIQNRRVAALALYAFVSYVAAFLAAALLPLPPLGLTPQFVADMHRGNDLWGAHFHNFWGMRLYIPIAFGAIYFSALACAKAVLVERAPSPVI